MRYPVANLGARSRLGENPRVDQLLVRYGFAYPPGEVPWKERWRACYDLAMSLAPDFDPVTPAGQQAVACLNDLLRHLGREGEIVEIELPEPEPGTCTPQGVKVNEPAAGYAPLACPSGDNCTVIIDANTGQLLYRDVQGNAPPSAICSRWGYRYGDPPGGWPENYQPAPGGGAGGTTQPPTQTPPHGGGVTYPPANLPGNQGGTAQGPKTTQVIPQEKKTDVSGIIGATLGLLGVGAAVYFGQK